ncbi:TRAP transporter large permease [Rhodovulum sulfidophilum]|uniref:TRAP transporter large permease n=1 Tax=Rhodovulum sulfidophilum TaxID=35806 RepID=UPI0005AA582B|nr:TRAP transporter large permease [Rhodovulum sulfidophilum]ANB33408.1 C4-dicarboxylate ABC transporter permease [Rhodovulum sulfidophilum DSM 1374]ANB37229.1 C4-dicarboxylate ABC transporter permease [Rhodovulum sulfidophilum]MCW2304356.1 C4-dicarboxylate transporter DctM subunit [Rhodovulum sulfidophilum]OLS53167.1 C4-dicarboxylate ABC transporter permease [Rhodovulum sulfidophilum]
MDPTLLMALSFVLLLLIGVPVGISMGLAAVLAMTSANMPMSYLVQTAYSAVDEFTIIAVPMFILAGTLMEKGGLTRRLIGFSRAIVGPSPGGLATVTIVACTFFAAISGSGPATTAAIGSIMIPAMIRDGYDRGFGAAITSSAGGIGVVIPPSIPMIIYGITSETSISALFVAGVVPGLLLAVVLWLTSRFISVRRGYSSGDVEPRSLRNIGRAALEAKWALAAPVLILGGIYSGVFTVTEASVVAVLYALFVGIFVYREIRVPVFIDAVVYAVRITGTVMLVLVTGRIIGRMLSMFQVPQLVSGFLIETVSDPIMLIVLVLLMLVFIGMWMETLTQIIILTPLLLPVVANVGIDPIQFGIIFVIACEIGYSTPPLGVNLFVASEIGETTVEKVSKASIPFLFAEIAVMALVAFVPQLTLWLPGLLGFVN